MSRKVDDDLQDKYCGIYRKVDGEEEIKVYIEWVGGGFGGPEYRVERMEKEK